ncbi:MAG: beta-ketoacyl-ACP synthase II [Chloroflexi bacterium]|nr:beta-ketoacyl-ACP synthase II [Chloroflexota bacterium]
MGPHPPEGLSGSALERQVEEVLERALGDEPSTLEAQTQPLRTARSDERRRVVITGLGILSCLGCDVRTFWERLVAGRSGIGPMTLCDPTGYPCRIAGEVRDFEPAKHLDAKEARRMARFGQLAVVAARQAVGDAGLELSRENPERLGVLMGNGNGGFPTTEEAVRILVEKGGMRISPFFFPMILPNMAAALISLDLGLRGYTNTVVTACAAGNQAIGEAAEVIRRGDADVIITGGVEAGISQLGLAGFAVMRALSTRNDEPGRASRPFDAERDGFVPAEGAGLLVLESLEHARARGATILAELAGYGVSADAYHLVAPDAEGAGPARAMAWALADAGLQPEEVDYINAHATSTPAGDLAETVAIRRLFGHQAYSVPVSATKSMVGHALGGAGGIEAVACVMTLREGIIHPTINYEHPDSACDLDYVPNKARLLEVRTVLSNGFGFGGQNACLIFRRWEE